MDAREQLRRYLEQRRELGEEELVLDRLEVDDVLRMVGALGRTPARPSSPAAPERRGQGAEQAPAADGGAVREVPAAYQPPARSGGASEPPATRLPEAGPRATEAARPSASFSDWREALRAAGGGPPGVVAPAASGGTRGDADRGDADGGANDKESEMAPAKKARKAADEASAATPAARPDGRAAAAAGPPADLPPWIAELGIPPGIALGKSGALDATFTALRSLDELASATERCRRCDLYRTATHAVPGEGNPDADLICVGEAPGANEDASGRPFVGAAGQLLTKILAAISLSREDVFICNVLKHRPPGNRNPLPEEVAACSPYLLRQLELVKPKVILTLGTFAAQTLLATKTPIGKLRGQVHLYHGIPLVVTYHPAALLRNSAWKRPTWEDVQLARRLLDRAPGA